MKDVLGMEPYQLAELWNTYSPREQGRAVSEAMDAAGQDKTMYMPHGGTCICCGSSGCQRNDMWVEGHLRECVMQLPMVPASVKHTHLVAQKKDNKGGE